MIIVTTILSRIFKGYQVWKRRSSRAGHLLSCFPYWSASGWLATYLIFVILITLTRFEVWGFEGENRILWLYHVCILWLTTLDKRSLYHIHSEIFLFALEEKLHSRRLSVHDILSNSIGGRGNLFRRSILLHWESAAVQRSSSFSWRCQLFGSDGAVG